MNIPALPFQIDKTARLVTAPVRGELAFDAPRWLLHTFPFDPDDIDQAIAWPTRKNGARRTAPPTGMSQRVARKTPSTKSQQLVRHNPTRWT